MGGWNINGPVAPPSSSKKKPEVERFVKKVKTREQLFEEYRLKDYGKADAAWFDVESCGIHYSKKNVY